MCIIQYEDRYNKILSLETISNYICSLYNPYKIRGREADLILTGKHKKVNRSDVKEIANDNKGLYVIIKPHQFEYDMIKMFALFEDKRDKLIQIRNLQLQLRKPYNEDNDDYVRLEDLKAIEQKIDGLFQDILGLLNPYNSKVEKATLPFYCEIGALFAQNLVFKKNELFCYKDHCERSMRRLSKYIQNEILNTEKNIYSYIQATLTEAETNKNFFNSLKQMNNIMVYCESKGMYILTYN